MSSTLQAFLMSILCDIFWYPCCLESLCSIRLFVKYSFFGSLIDEYLFCFGLLFKTLHDEHLLYIWYFFLFISKVKLPPEDVPHAKLKTVWGDAEHYGYNDQRPVWRLFVRLTAAIHPLLLCKKGLPLEILCYWSLWINLSFRFETDYRRSFISLVKFSFFKSRVMSLSKGLRVETFFSTL